MNLLPVDIEQFWKNDKLAHEENCFSENAPQVAMGIRMSDECVFAELNEEGTPWGHTPRDKRIDFNKRYNDISEKIVGIRLLREELPPVDAAFPYVKRIGEVFGGRYIWQNDSEWLESDIKTPQELEAQLDRIEKMDIKSFMLPDNWEAECKRLYEQYGLRPSPLRHIRGPVTLACSIFGVENLLFLLMDEEELSARLFQTIGDVIIAMADIMDAETGKEPVRGFSFADDNCCLLNPDMYEQFAYPVLKRVFEKYSPDRDDKRYQHSDSAMGHLLPILGRLNFTGVNFGPTVLIDEIRKYMPKARIDGCIAPFTFMNNDREQLIKEVRRDCEMAKLYGRGVNLSTAGSINNGSTLENMRTVMWGIQQYGQY